MSEIDDLDDDDLPGVIDQMPHQIAALRKNKHVPAKVVAAAEANLRAAENRARTKGLDARVSGFHQKG